MPNLLQRLEARWMRRHADPPISLPGDAGRQPVTVVTGASEGLGRALAREFAARGHRLLLVARDNGRLNEVAAGLRHDFGIEVHVAPIDLAAIDALSQLEGALNRAGLYPDYLINNAGIGLGGPFTNQDEGQLDQLQGLNMGALTALTRRFLPDMLARAQGGVLNIASIGGLFPGPYQAAYYASKAYVVSLTEALAYENAGRGVRISAAIPGPIATRYHEKVGAAHALYLRLQPVPSPESVARAIFSGFMGRRTLIAPGILTAFNAVAVRFLPHFLLVPFVGWFLKQRS
jgi:short-subunit dehydrogenase